MVAFSCLVTLRSLNTESCWLPYSPVFSQFKVPVCQSGVLQYVRMRTLRFDLPFYQEAVFPQYQQIFFSAFCPVSLVHIHKKIAYLSTVSYRIWNDRL